MARKNVYVCDFNLGPSCLGERTYGVAEQHHYCTVSVLGLSLEVCDKCLPLIGQEGSRANRLIRESLPQTTEQRP